MALNAEEWVEIGLVFKDSLDHVLASLRHRESAVQERVNVFVYKTVLFDHPYMLCTPNGVKDAVETIFSDVHLRDFVLTLSFTFFSRWGASNEKYLHLTETLAFAVSADGATTPASNTSLIVQSAIPVAIFHDMPKDAQTRAVLLANKWLAVLLLIQLVVQAPEATKPKAVKK